MRMLIAGEWCEASDGAVMDVVDPGYGPAHRHRARRDRGRYRPCHRGCAAGTAGDGGHAGPRALRHPHPGSQAARGRARGRRSDAGAGERQADPSDARGGRCRGSHHPRLRRGGQADLRAPGTHGRGPGQRAPCRLHHPPTGRRRLRGGAVQLSPRALRAQGRGRAGSRERRHRQAAQRLPADAPAPGGDPRAGRPAARGASDDHRQRRPHRPARRSQPRRAAGHADRQRRDRHRARPHLRRDDEAVPCRARGQ